MKSEKGIIEIFVIGIVIILFIILFTAIGIMIKLNHFLNPPL